MRNMFKKIQKTTNTQYNRHSWFTLLSNYIFSFSYHHIDNLWIFRAFKNTVEFWLQWEKSMDNTGKIFVPIIFDKVGQFYNGQAMVAVNNKYCIIDTSGKQVNTDSVTLKLPKIIDSQRSKSSKNKQRSKTTIFAD